VDLIIDRAEYLKILSELTQAVKDEERRKRAA
jgi:hypothetical protein